MGEAERDEKLQHIRYYFDHNIIQNRHCEICEREEILEYFNQRKAGFLEIIKYVNKFDTQATLMRYTNAPAYTKTI